MAAASGITPTSAQRPPSTTILLLMFFFSFRFFFFSYPCSPCFPLHFICRSPKYSAHTGHFHSADRTVFEGSIKSCSVPKRIAICQGTKKHQQYANRKLFSYQSNNVKLSLHQSNENPDSQLQNLL